MLLRAEALSSTKKGLSSAAAYFRQREQFQQRGDEQTHGLIAKSDSLSDQPSLVLDLSFKVRNYSH
jgi:hypothetical protein